VIPDAYITESRLKAFRELPWPIPALVIVGMTDEDLDRLAVAPNPTVYWRTLNAIVRRMEASTVEDGAA
jgi:ParB-like chromosome segregation protein Spo0J